ATDDKWHFLESGELIWQSEMEGYNHLYWYAADGKEYRALTDGAFEVAELIGIDEANKKIFYLSTEDSPLERQLYSVNFKGKKKLKLTQAAGWHDITPSSAFSYFVDEYSSTTQVPVAQLIDAKGESVLVLEENKGLEQRLSQLDIQASEFFTFETSDGAELNGWMIKPTDFDPEKKYPVLMFCYGGPGSQEVLNGWGHNDPFNYMWYQMLAQEGYLIACVDNRGTGARGRDFRAVTYADMGKYEVFDQVQAAKYLQKQSYVDADRIGIWGWSFGGYLTSLCMTKGRGLFKAGIAVAPVTNWRFYDTIYTERYLKTPQENPDGYDKNSPLNFARGLEGSYLLVHGTGDDNVHFQNTVEWTNALISANKQFDVFFYPNRTHGIAGGITRFHLYTKMTNFIRENL
ncbi:MAG: alpha/beta fold hydrolase, partial [Bacteroidota bacterium]